MTDGAWGTLSNQAVAAAAVVYFLALLAYVVEWASLRQVDKSRVMAGAGGPEVAEQAPAERARDQGAEFDDFQSGKRFGVERHEDPCLRRAWV
jgi:hypothetical protein